VASRLRQAARKWPPWLRETALVLRHPVQRLLLRGVYNRIRQLEYRSFNRRYYAIEQIAEYLVGAQVEGDYCEFGVYRGATFSHAFAMMASLFPRMRFVAFDSFRGLPEPRGIDAADGYTSHFHAGQFEFSRQAFERELRRNGVALERVRMVEGWYDETLAEERAATHGVGKVAAAWIDCDLYESTVPVLRYLTRRLLPGAVLVFDDWRCYRNSPEFGEQRACREWLQANPHIQLRELFSFGWNGVAFTVEC
jgi:hypothetical protein